MIPFGQFLYFGILLYLAIPIVVASLAGVKPRRFLLAITLVMLALQFGMGHGTDWRASAADVGKVFGFAAAQWAIASAFCRVRRHGRNQPVFYGAVALALVPLVLEKFVVDARSIVAFVGISYLTFRALDVIFVTQDGLVNDVPVVEYLAFLLFFPAISAGPIDRYRRFAIDYRKERSRAEFLADLDAAADRIFTGLLYSFVIARLVDFYWMTPTSLQTGPIAVLSYMYAYSIHLFFDFAGYSAFAIGTGYVLGVRMPENFARPYLAKNIVEFWNTWHISLSSWLRDHVYGRFVLTATRRRWFKDPTTAGYLGTTLAFGLMGVWHGPEARYLFYGFYHALLVVVHGMLNRQGRVARRHIPAPVARLVTLHLVGFGFLVFSGRLF